MRTGDPSRLDARMFDGARLDGARLDGARLDGARLDGARLVASGSEHAGVLRDIARWVDADPCPQALLFLLSTPAQAALQRLRDSADDRFGPLSTLHRSAVDRHLAPMLQVLVEGDLAGAAELAALVENDPIPAAFAPPGPSAREVALERCRLLARLGQPFAAWWQSYFGSDAHLPLTELWRLYLPFAQWIIREKRRRRPGELFMVGFNGSPGAGKTVLTNALAVILNQLLDLDAEGQAIARSGDDWYLGRAAREPLRARGYDPALPGVSNRALPGTHDLAWLRQNLAELERANRHSVIRMGCFDKKIDDQPADPGRRGEVRGKVGVFLFDLWFAGAVTDVDPGRLPDGLRRRVAEQLRHWQPVFDRMDALWAFDWPAFDRMLAEREAQEQLVEQRRGARGMNSEQLRTFMAYMLEQAWDWRTTSPIPPDRLVSFHAWRDSRHRVIAVQRGGRES